MPNLLKKRERKACKPGTARATQKTTSIQYNNESYKKERYTLLLIATLKKRNQVLIHPSIVREMACVKECTGCLSGQ